MLFMGGLTTMIVLVVFGWFVSVTLGVNGRVVGVVYVLLDLAR